MWTAATGLSPFILFQFVLILLSAREGRLFGSFLHTQVHATWSHASGSFCLICSGSLLACLLERGGTAVFRQVSSCLSLFLYCALATATLNSTQCIGGPNFGRDSFAIASVPPCMSHRQHETTWLLKKLGWCGIGPFANYLVHLQTIGSLTHLNDCSKGIPVNSQFG